MNSISGRLFFYSSGQYQRNEAICFRILVNIDRIDMEHFHRTAALETELEIVVTTLCWEIISAPCYVFSPRFLWIWEISPSPNWGEITQPPAEKSQVNVSVVTI